MSRRWTAASCLAQLRALKVEVTLTEQGTIKLTSTKGVDLTPTMLRVIKKHKPGIVWLLHKEASRTQSAKEPCVYRYRADEEDTLRDVPELRSAVDAIKRTFADVGGATLTVARRKSENLDC